jgi:hypothetical protein
MHGAQAQAQAALTVPKVDEVLLACTTQAILKWNEVTLLRYLLVVADSQLHLL